MDLRPAPRLMIRFVAVAMALGLSGCGYLGDPAFDEPRPAVIGIEIEIPERVETTFEIQVSDVDANAMGLQRTTISDDFGTFLLRTSHTETTSMSYEHCLIEPLTVTRIRSGDEVATVPAGTCLSSAGKNFEIARVAGGG